MQIIGVDIGSSSVKVSVMDGESGKLIVSSFSPHSEMTINAPQKGWAEQDPEAWYENFKISLLECLKSDVVRAEAIKTIGISYQMHGLVAVDREQKVIRPSIIWCDSRAVSIGDKALQGIGEEYCRANLLNSPGNFTASKLAWLKRHEPDNYKRIYKIMLPGDYLAMRLCGEINTTVSGMSEGVFWDFRSDTLSNRLLSYYGIDKDLIPEVLPVFSVQGYVRDSEAVVLGLSKSVSIGYRAGDQPNNALSLNVLEPGEIAATAGTSGVIYGVSDRVLTDKNFRVNLFAHVNHSPEKKRLGILACINGTGIMNAWAKRLTGIESYSKMNELAAEVKPGSDGLYVFPFGNGAERLLENLECGASFSNINLNTHGPGHIYRAVQESIAFSFRYALDIMKELGMDPGIIRAGYANMFQSPVFTSVLASLTGVPIHMYNTDGSLGAARGAGYGAAYYGSLEEAFSGLELIEVITSGGYSSGIYNELYDRWKESLFKILKNKN